jgi:transposase
MKKLSREKVFNIREDCKTMKQKEVAKKYGVTVSVIYEIKHKKRNYGKII